MTDKQTYSGEILFPGGDSATAKGTIQEIANWTDNVIRAQGDDRDMIFIHIKKIREEQA